MLAPRGRARRPRRSEATPPSPLPRLGTRLASGEALPGDRREQDESRWSEWMARAGAGDRDAYAKLMTELGGAVEAYVRSRFGGTDPDFVEDCVQESLLAVHRARHTWDPRRPFRPWFFTLVRHKTIDLLRKERVRTPTATLEEAEERSAPPADPGDRIDGATLLDELDPKYREALVLTRLEGYSMEEAAKRADVSVGAMKTRVHRAIRLVQKRLGAEERSEEAPS